MIAPPVPDNETLRLATLRLLDILDTAPEQAFDDLTALAAHVCGTPIALVSLVDQSRQWFKSAHGLDAVETPRTLSFCGHAIIEPDRTLVVEDASLDARFADNPLVTGPPFIRAYAGAPLVAGDGMAVGTLCVIDRTPRQLSAAQLDALQRIARLVVAQMTVREVSRRLTTGEARLSTVSKDLAVSEQRYRALVDHAQGLICTHDLDGTITMANVAAGDLLGYPPERLIGMNLREFLRPADRPAFEDYLAQFTHTRRASGVMSLLAADGRPLALAYRNFRFDASGEAPSVIAHAVEISDRIEAERLNRRFAAVTDASPDLFSLVTPEGRPIYLNAAGRRMLALPPGAPLPAFIVDPVTAPADAMAVGEPLVLAEASGVWEGDTIVRGLDGRATDVHQLTLLHRNENGEPDFFATVMRDVTDARRTAETIRAGEEKLRAVVNGLREVLFETDADGHWLFLNPAWTEITGFSLEESIGRPFFEFLVPEDVELNRERFAPLVRREKEYCRHQIRYRSKDGGFRWIEVHARLLLDPQDRIAGTTGTLRDVTAERSLAAELVQAREEALTASRLKSEFLANMSHEIRTPINGVLGLATLLADTPLSTEQRECTEGITRSGESLLAIVNDVLDLSKIEAGRMDVERVPFDIRRILDQVRDTVGVKARARHLAFDVHCADDVPGMVVGDGDRLRQVLLNLADNAVKFTPAGRVSVRVSRPVGQDDALAFSVRDTGIGIPREKVAAVFDTFSQADSSTARRFGGTGLGLAICRQLVALMGGSIGVDSEEGVGSVFTVTLPLPASGPNAEAGEEAGGGHPTSNAVPLPAHVLLVEDNPINQKVASRFLQKEGCVVDVADHGRAALALAQQRRYDAIFMDCQMPEMDGYETTIRIRRLPQYAGCPIVGVTAHAMVGDREKCLAAGMTDYLSKPLRPGDIRGALVRAAGQTARRARQAGASEEAEGCAEAGGSGQDSRPFDAEMVIDAFDGDLVEIGEFVGLVLGSVPRYFQALREAAASTDWEKTASLAHTLRGSVGNIGAARVAALARDVESAARARDLLPDLTLLSNAVETLVSALVRWRQTLDVPIQESESR